MPKEMFQRYKNGSLKGALFKGGDVEKIYIIVADTQMMVQKFM